MPRLVLEAHKLGLPSHGRRQVINRISEGVRTQGLREFAATVAGVCTTVKNITTEIQMLISVGSVSLCRLLGKRPYSAARRLKFSGGFTCFQNDTLTPSPLISTWMPGRQPLNYVKDSVADRLGPVGATPAVSAPLLDPVVSNLTSPLASDAPLSRRPQGCIWL